MASVPCRCGQSWAVPGSGPSASGTPGSNGWTSSRVTASPEATIDDTTSTVSARTGEQVA